MTCAILMTWEHGNQKFVGRIMEKIFINFTNHRSEFWCKKQIDEAEKYGVIIDIPFPDVDPFWSEQEIQKSGEKYYNEIMAYAPAAVLCQGEFTLALNVIKRLQKSGVTVVAACSRRSVSEAAGTKVSVFEFVRFREYM